MPRPAPPAGPLYEANRLTDPWLGWQEQVEETNKALRIERKVLRTQEAKKSTDLARKKMQKLFATKQKQANKIISGASAGDQITTLRNDAGKIVSDPAAVKGVVSDFFENLGRPINGKKTGSYHPNEAPRDYPWAKDKDSFTLRSKIDAGATKGISLLDLIQDKACFRLHVRTLAKGKAPGKDGIANELLKNLPDELHEAIHDIFTLRYMLGKTPDNRKSSETVFMYKKVDPSSDYHEGSRLLRTN